MIWFFLAVVLVLMVHNEGFRRVVFWIAGIVAGVFALLALVSVIDNASRQPPTQGWQPPETNYTPAQRHANHCAEAGVTFFANGPPGFPDVHEAIKAGTWSIRDGVPCTWDEVRRDVPWLPK